MPIAAGATQQVTLKTEIRWPDDYLLRDQAGQIDPALLGLGAGLIR